MGESLGIHSCAFRPLDFDGSRGGRSEEIRRGAAHNRVARWKIVAARSIPPKVFHLSVEPHRAMMCEENYLRGIADLNRHS